MSYGTFRSAMAGQLGIPDLELGPSSDLRDDWDLDSFDLMMLLVWMEAGRTEAIANVPPPVLRTMGDAFAYYEALRVAAASAP